MAYNCEKWQINTWWGRPSKWNVKKTIKKQNCVSVIFWDITRKITRRKDPSFIARCDKSLALSYSVVGAEVRWVWEWISIYGYTVSNLRIHVSRNHLPRNHPNNMTAKISKLLLHANKRISEYTDFFSPQSYPNLRTQFLKWLVMSIVKYWTYVSTTSS